MDDFEDLPNHLFVSLRYAFSATRVVDKRLTPTNIKFKLDFSPREEESDEAAARIESSLAKIEYFVENVLDGALLIDWTNGWAMDSFIDGETKLTSNPIVLFPEMPTDALMCELILRKFRAISDNAFVFHSIEIESSDGRGMGFTFVGGTPGEDFPEINDWVGERSYFSKPWWDRGDASTMDVIPDPESDLNTPPKWAFSLGFIDEESAAPLPDNVVVRAEFRPKVIEGGKKD